MNLDGARRVLRHAFYPMGYRYWDTFYVNDDEAANGVVSHEPLQHDLGSFGFGAQTRVDLPFEQGRAGSQRRVEAVDPRAIPSRSEGEWFPGDFILMTIGQATPSSRRCSSPPPFVRARERRQGSACRTSWTASSRDDTRARFHQNCRRHVRIDERYLRYVRDALTGTMTGGGTAASCVRRVPVRRRLGGGKTGTAEVPPKQDYSWFAAMTAAGGARRGGAGRAGRSRRHDGRADRAAHHRGPLRPRILPVHRGEGTD